MQILTHYTCIYFICMLCLRLTWREINAVSMSPWGYGQDKCWISVVQVCLRIGFFAWECVCMCVLQKRRAYYRFRETITYLACRLASVRIHFRLLCYYIFQRATPIVQNFWQNFCHANFRSIVRATPSLPIGATVIRLIDSGCHVILSHPPQMLQDKQQRRVLTLGEV